MEPIIKSAKMKKIIELFRSRLVFAAVQLISAIVYLKTELVFSKKLSTV